MNHMPSGGSSTLFTTSLSERQVIDQILGGEKELFEVIIRSYNPILHKIGMSYGFHHMDTQDLMQETFVNVYCNLSSFNTGPL